ncbi:DUF4394 domain-containing protein [Methylophilus methylotrophus]|uniref:DUF4394 domain-containing protein n=1 Tax=Methylophilus methylotrophus TaxID=17 RepID=UPI000F5B4BE2|nr:DUF4394 domain-containing protein [Methylophilus methylotrophus]
MKKSVIYKAILGTSLLVAASQVNADTLYGVNSSSIAVIDTLNLGAVSYINISGLAANERLLGVDLRPTDGLVYGLTSQNRLYTLDTTTGAATFKSNLTGASLAGQSIGIDFNPVADFAGNASLRVVTGTGNNYAVNANTGVVGNTAGANIGSGYTAVAYTNSEPGVTPASTGLYYVNSTTDSLNFLASGFNNPAGAGGIQTVGTLGVDVLSANGFDILGNGKAYALFNLDNGTLDSQLFSINLMTGAATYITTLNGTFNGLTGVAAAVPEPTNFAFLLAGLGLMAGVVTRRARQRA